MSEPKLPALGIEAVSVKTKNSTLTSSQAYTASRKSGSKRKTMAAPLDVIPLSKHPSCHCYEAQIKQPYSVKPETIEKDSSTTIPLELSQSWYKRRGWLAEKNEGRKECAIAKQKGTFEENISTLKDDCDKKNPSWNNKKKLEMINVGEYILQHGPFVPTQEVGHGLAKFKKKENVFGNIEKHQTLL